jgi:hypothetical protein
VILLALVGWPTGDHFLGPGASDLCLPDGGVEFTEHIKTGKQYTLPPNPEQIGMETASVCAARDSHAELRLYNYEEALKADPLVAKLIQLANITALGSHIPPVHPRA